MSDFRYPDGQLLIFARAPVPGRVKTRLQPRLGPAGCAALQQRLIGHAVHTAVTSRTCPVELDVAGDPDHPAIRNAAARYGVVVRAQTGDGLGERMANALRRTLEAARFALILGCDCPAVTAGTLLEACHALDTNPVILSPAEDGGYGLIGSRVAHPAIFNAVDWGTGRVLEQTRRNLHAAGLGWTELDTLWDVDRPEDLDRLFALPDFTDWKTEIEQ